MRVLVELMSALSKKFDDVIYSWRGYLLSILVVLVIMTLTRFTILGTGIPSFVPF